MNKIEQPIINIGQKIDELPEDYTVIDIETTGLSPAKNEIIQLSALKVRNNKIVDSFNSFVKPDGRISSFISSLTGITNDMVSVAPQIKDVLNDYIDFIGKDIIVGHNVHFDINFVRTKMIQHFNQGLPNNYVDTCRMSRKICPISSHKLDSVARYYNVDSTGHHRADNDCKMTFEIYNCMKKDLLSK